MTLIVYNNKFILSASYKHTIMKGVISLALSYSINIGNWGGFLFYKSVNKVLTASSPPPEEPLELPPDTS